MRWGAACRILEATVSTPLVEPCAAHWVPAVSYMPRAPRVLPSLSIKSPDLIAMSALMAGMPSRCGKTCS